jgi:hypothetical protein
MGTGVYGYRIDAVRAILACLLES